MATIVYGTHVFTKFMGYYGDAVECPNCGKTYKQSFVKYSSWAHFEYIPLFPVKKVYAVMCPVCGYGAELKSAEAKPLMQDEFKDSYQNLEAYAIRNVNKRPIDYDFYVRDVNTNEEMCIMTELAKGDIKRIKKNRGLKKVDIIDVK